jgi:hypothetical protein
VLWTVRSYKGTFGMLKGQEGTMRKRRLHYWHNSPWDFGEKKCDGVDPKEDDGVWVDSEPNMSAWDHLATVEECLDDDGEGLRNIKVKVASVSNLGVCLGTAPLKQREVIDNTCSDCTDEHVNQGISTLSVEEANDRLENIVPGTEQPEISVGADASILTCKAK